MLAAIWDSICDFSFSPLNDYLKSQWPVFRNGLHLVVLFLVLGLMLGAWVGWELRGIREPHGRSKQETEPDQLTLARSRPCAGDDWQFQITYQKYRNIKTNFTGLGNAIMIWKGNGYDVHFWIKISQEGDPENIHVVLVADGKLSADRDGQPRDGDSLSFSYSVRVGQPPPFNKHLHPDGQYTSLHFIKSNDGSRIEKITGRFHTDASDGEVKFTRK